MIPPQVIEEIRNRSDIIKVISEFVVLKKRGKNYLGLCPFHSEKDASFTVSAEKQLFHCFGCGEGGNVVTFLMKIENIGFAEAVTELGEKIGITIDRPISSGASKSDKDKLYDILSLANKFFMKCLFEDSGKAARDYLKQRGIRDEMAKTFALGAAPDSWDSLFNFLISRGASPLLIEHAGLTLPRESGDGFYDRFRSRLIFPVFDARGRIIAFSGRALDSREPKYLNSPDTPVYRKGECLFGLQAAKESIKKEKTTILVEGNLDLLTVYQAGITNIVAPLGTALTVSQCKLLSRYSDTVLLAFDSDAAGEAAAERSAELLRSQGLKVKIVEIKGVKDPDELVQKEGIESFKKALASALPFLEFKIKQAIGRHNTFEIEGRAKALREVINILSGEKDHFTQKEYARMASRLLDVDPETILAEIRKVCFYQRNGGKDQRRFTEKPASKLAEAEKYLIAAGAQDKTALEKIKSKLGPDDFTSPEAKALARLLFSVDLSKVEKAEHFIWEKLSESSVQNFLTQALLSESWENSSNVIEDCINVIKAEKAKSRVAQLKQELLKAEKAGETQKAAGLLAAIKSEISQPAAR